MDFARKLFGSSEQEHRDFVDRYQQGPREVSEREAASRYEQVAPNLPPRSTSSQPRTSFRR